MNGHSDWAARLGFAVTSKLATVATTIQLHSVKATAPELLEIIYSDSVDGIQYLKGLRLDLSTVKSAAEIVRSSSVEELALDLVYVGICEPRSIDEFLPPDSHGIRWLPAQRWLNEF